MSSTVWDGVWAKLQPPQASDEVELTSKSRSLGTVKLYCEDDDTDDNHCNDEALTSTRRPLYHEKELQVQIRNSDVPSVAHSIPLQEARAKLQGTYEYVVALRATVAGA